MTNRILTIIISVAFVHIGFGQNQNTIEQVKNSISKVDSWYCCDQDIDSLVSNTGKILANYLTFNRLQHVDSLVNLDVISSKDSIITVYTFSYHSGGTRGRVHNPVIQWIKRDATLGSYELFPANKKGFFGLEVSFYEIHKLPTLDKKLYLLLGNERGSSKLLTAQALVIEIKNDSIILDYPAFYGTSSTLGFFDYISENQVCIACLNFDATNNLLYIEEIDEEDKLGPFNNPYSLENKLTNESKVIFKFINNKFELTKSLHNN